MAHVMSLPGMQLARAAWLCACVLACLAGWAAGRAGAAESGDELEQRVKAAFLYKFAGYVDWPAASFASSDTPITIAVVGAEPLAAELTQVVAGRTINNRNLTVRRIKAGESLSGVHILFVGSAEQPRMAQLARAARENAVLAVSESEGALNQGSMINFIVTDRRVRFEVGLDSAEKGGLRLSSRLLAVAHQVRTGNP